MNELLKIGVSSPSLVTGCDVVEPSPVNNQSTGVSVSLDLQSSRSEPFACRVASVGLCVNAPSDPVCHSETNMRCSSEQCSWAVGGG